MQIQIYDVRKRFGLTLEQAVALIDMPTLHDYEIHKSSPPINMLEKIARGLGVYIEDLYKSDYINVILYQKEDKESIAK